MSQTQHAVFHHGDQRRIDYVAGADIVSGELINLGGGLVGVCTDPQGIANGHRGAVAVDGIFKIKKDSTDTFARGVEVAWDEDAEQAEPDGGANDDFSIGQCIEAAIASDDHVKVWINHHALVESGSEEPSEPTSIMVVAVDSATVIEVGDMLFLDTDDAKPASDFTWDSDLSTTQASFAAVFLGIALEASANGETVPIQVETSPQIVFEDYGVANGNYDVGDSFGPDENPVSTLANQILEAAAGTSSIARAVESGTGVTELNVGFASAFHPGSANINAHVG